MTTLKRILSAAVTLLALSAPAWCQSYIPFSGSSVQDAGGNMLANGQICALVTDANDVPIPIKVSGGGNAIIRNVCASVTAGAIQSGFQIANPATSWPPNFYVRVQVVDLDAGTRTTYPKVAITGSSFNWDSYLPGASSMLPFVPVIGPTGATGPQGAPGTGSIAGLSSYGPSGIAVLGESSFSGLNLYNNPNPVSPYAPLPGQNYIGPVANAFYASVYTLPFPAWQTYASIYSYVQHLDGGYNYYQDGMSNKAGTANLSIVSESHTGGSTMPLTLSNYQYGLGDTFNLYSLVYCSGGTSGAGDEGCSPEDLEVFQGSADYAGPITAGGTTGSTSITVAPTQAAGTQGVGRFAVDANPAKTITAGTITAVTKSTYTTYTGSGTSWPVSTVNTTLGTAVTNVGTFTVTPASMTGITTSTVLCLQDAGNYQTVIPTTTTGTTFTAYFNGPQLATATVTAGGLCGYFVGINADKYGTMLDLWPVFRSTSSTSMDVWISGTGTYVTYPGAWSAGDGTYTLYPGSTVSHVNSGTSLVNTLTLEPNTTPWASGDTVDEPIYPFIAQGAEHLIVSRTIAGGSVVGRHLTFSGGFAGTLGAVAYGDWMENQTGAGYYSNTLNRYAPTLFNITGVWGNGLNFQSMPNTVINVGSCSLTSGCGLAFPMVIHSGSNVEYMEYNQALGTWNFSTGFNTSNVTFNSDGSISAAKLYGSSSSGLGAASTPFVVQGGAGATTDFQIKNAAGSATLFSMADNGNVTGPGGVSNLGGFYSSAFTAIASQYYKLSSGNWQIFDPGFLDIYDSTNGVGQLSIYQGAGHTGSVNAAGTLSGYALNVGSSSQVKWDANGVKHEAGTAPTASTGTITGTNAGGYVSGLSAVTTLTLTFANSGWTAWASCVANTNVSATQPYISVISKTAVTFTFPSLTGTLYYHCDGN